ncbi:ABC transporter permease [Candidatus Roseilinea sp. NK_OTU-006]|jgi:ABC-2 type transport system permease protein|uniref:ABC transporter permease n=1 Tax=Candidatus Roseilinea sp. NK_OTU-006 TaxID=2704250 RepID=UPI00145EA165|nr:ABC transporter permease [Candidatus Roseilinea sp. NK_OTU-006]
MSKTWVVLKHEFRTIVSKPSFWFGIIGLPIIIGAVIVVISLISGVATAAVATQRTSQSNLPHGFVDYAGIVRRADDGFERFAGEPEAERALRSGAIEAFYVIPADYMQTGQVRMVTKELDDSPLGPRRRVGAFQRMVNRNLLDDEALWTQLDRQVNITQSESVATVRTRTGPSFGGFSPLVYGVAVLFFTILITASAYLMQSVTTEKENRVIEILMSSVSPADLLAGKILGLSLVGLIQMVLWFGSAILALTRLPFLSEVIGPISPAAVLLTALFFVLSYFVYASLLAGLGALMPGSREAAQYTFLVSLPLFVPLYLNTAITAEPNGPLAVALSLIPFTSPLVMPMRLFGTSVPPLEVAISLALLAGLVYLAIQASARAFRAQALLSGSKPTLKQVIAAFFR